MISGLEAYDPSRDWNAVEVEWFARSFGSRKSPCFGKLVDDCDYLAFAVSVIAGIVVLACVGHRILNFAEVGKKACATCGHLGPSVVGDDASGHRCHESQVTVIISHNDGSNRAEFPGHVGWTPHARHRQLLVGSLTDSAIQPQLQVPRQWQWIL